MEKQTEKILEKATGLGGLKKILNEIDHSTYEEDSELYIESIRITHGGPNNSFTYFQITAYDPDDRKLTLDLYFSKNDSGCNANFRNYEKACPKTCKIIRDNCFNIIREVLKAGVEVDSILTQIRGDVEFIVMLYINGSKELRGGYYWSDTYEEWLVS